MENLKQKIKNKWPQSAQHAIFYDDGFEINPNLIPEVAETPYANSLGCHYATGWSHYIKEMGRILPSYWTCSPRTKMAKDFFKGYDDAQAFFKKQGV
jgi:hypothetical protein